MSQFRKPQQLEFDLPSQHYRKLREEDRRIANEEIQRLKEIGCSCKTCGNMQATTPYWHVCTIKANKPIKFYNLCEKWKEGN